MIMREIGDTVKLNKKQEDYPMCSQGDGWDKYITYQIILTYPGGTYLARNGLGREELIHEENIL